METSNLLSFLKTYSVASFKKTYEIDSSIDIIKNPKTGRLFFTCRTCGGDRITGSLKSDATSVPTNPVISLVEGVDSTSGEIRQFLLLHKESQSADNLILSL